MARFDQAAVGMGRRSRTIRRTIVLAGLLSGLGMPALMGIPTCAAIAQTAGQTHYMTSGSLQLPAKFADAIVASGNASSDTLTVDGKSQTVYTALLRWPGTELSDAGTVVVNKPNSYPRVSGRGDPDWDAFVPKLIGISKASGGWSVVTVGFVAPQGGTAPLVTSSDDKVTVANPATQLAGGSAPAVGAATACTSPTVVVPNNGVTTTPLDPAGFVAAMLKLHNDARAEWGEDKLVWDDALAADATAYSQWLLAARGGALDHYFPTLDRVKGVGIPKPSVKGYFGENLSGGNPTSSGASEVMLGNGWLREKTAFCQGAYPGNKWNGNTKFSNAGHYSQVIWRNTTRLGCGVATMDDRRLLTCRYRLGGNGDYEPASAGSPPGEDLLNPTEERVGAKIEPDFQSSMLSLNNKVRAKKGLQPLVWDATLTDKAQAKAVEVANVTDKPLWQVPVPSDEVRAYSTVNIWDDDFYYRSVAVIAGKLTDGSAAGSASNNKIGCASAARRNPAVGAAAPESLRVVSCHYGA